MMFVEALINDNSPFMENLARKNLARKDLARKDLAKREYLSSLFKQLKYKIAFILVCFHYSIIYIRILTRKKRKLLPQKIFCKITCEKFLSLLRGHLFLNLQLSFQLSLFSGRKRFLRMIKSLTRLRSLWR